MSFVLFYFSYIYFYQHIKLHREEQHSLNLTWKCIFLRRHIWKIKIVPNFLYKITQPPNRLKSSLYVHTLKSLRSKVYLTFYLLKNFINTKKYQSFQGCTHPNTYEPVVGVLSDMIPLLELSVIDPTQSLAFPMTVVALLPYMLLHYEDANELCVKAACHIAQVSGVKNISTYFFCTLYRWPDEESREIWQPKCQLE